MRDDISLDWQIDLDSHGMVNWECRLNGEDGVLAGASEWRSVLCWVALMSCPPEFPDIDCQNWCSTMLILRVDFGDVGRNCTMDFSARRTCPRVRTPECGLNMLARTLPTRQECLVHEVPSGAVARGCAVARWRGCMVVCGCAEESTGAGEIACVQDQGYVRLVTDGESPVCVQPVTGSHLIGSPLRRVLGLLQPHLPSGGMSWTILGDFCFSCHLVWWNTMSSGVDLPVVDQAGAAPAATDPLPGTFVGLGLDLYDGCDGPSGHPRADIVKVMSVP